MRLVNVQAKNPKTKEAYKFTLGDLNEESKLVSSRGAVLMYLLKDVFSGIDYGNFDISVDFLEGDVVYNIIKNRKDGETVFTVRKLDSENKMIEAATGKDVPPYLRAVLGGDPSEILNRCFITSENLAGFCEKGDFSQFAIIDEEIKAKQQEIEKQLRDTLVVNQRDIEFAVGDLELRQDVAEKVKAKFVELQNRLAESASYGLTKELASARDQLKELESKKAFIDTKRKQLVDYDNVAFIVPKLKTLDGLNDQLKGLATQCEESQKELDWYESEYASVTKQLDEKQRALYKIITNRVNVQAVEAQLTRSKELTERNTKLTENLTKLNSQMSELEAQKVTLKNGLNSLDDAIAEIKANMDEFTDPDKGFADLLESVRINAKIDELESQIEKYKAEITVKENQIDSREKLLVTQTRQFRNIMDLDHAVSPYKARETIMAVLDFKLEKLNIVNSSLKEKMRNLYRARENANYQLTGITQSSDALENELNKKRKIKGEEFKRQVLINSQKIYQDATAVYAVENDLEDDEITSLEYTLKSRNEEKQKAVELAARITGALDEIQRHIDINQSEINSLNDEKRNIVDHYNQLIHENTNETVANYLRAIETDKGTNYLLEISNDTVRTETEMKEIKKSVDNAKLRLSEAQTRLKQMTEARTIIDGEQGTMEGMMHLNEQTKNELSDIAARLTTVYAKQKTALGRIDEIDIKINRVKEIITETSKTIKVNEREIEYAHKQTEKLAGGSVEKVLEQLKFDEREANADVTMLIGSKTTIETQLLDKRVAFNQLKWLKENKDLEYQTLKEVLRQEFVANNVEAEWVASVADLSDEDIEKTRSTVAQYDKTVTAMKERIKHLASLVSETTPVDKVLLASIKQAKKELDIANKDLERAKETHEKLLSAFAAATTAHEKMQEKAEFAPKGVIEFLKRSNILLYDMTGLKLKFKRGLSVYNDKEEIRFITLDKSTKTAIFIAMTLAYPSQIRAKTEFIILDEGMSHEKLKEYFSNQVEFVCVTDCRYTKPKEAV
ncbi:MAG TPA: hypothetical protein PK675_01715 [Clostridia bacterium]|nr:hypothetical protein [Clostridia bacterium]